MQDHTSASAPSKTLSHCKNTASGSRCAARKTTRWCAARANTPTISPCRARPMPGWCAPAMPTGSSRASTPTAAKAMPGVLGVWTGKDLAAAGYNPFTCGLPLKSRDGSPLLQTNRTALATDKVRFVGDPVAFVVAETLAQARDAAEAVELDIEPLPAVTDAAEAAKPGAPQLYDHIPNNVALDYHYGDSAKIDAAFAAAAHVTKLDIVNTRVAVVSMEPRVALAAFDKASRALHAAGADAGRLRQQGDAGENPQRAERQGSHPDRQCRRLLRHEERQLSRIYLHPARGEGAGPPGEMDRRALDQLPLRQPWPRAADPRRTGARCRGQVPRGRALQGYGNLGAYITGVAPGPLSLNTGKNLASVYRTPLLGVDIKTVLTNTTLMGAYRGAGRPEANYYMERLIDRAADEMGINRLTLRKRNFIKPAQLPFAASSGVTYDSGDFAGRLQQGAGDFRPRQILPSARRKAGSAASCAASPSAPIWKSPRLPSGELGKITFEPDGSVKLTTGTLDYGQGHATPFAQVLSAQLGVPFDKITLEQNDSDLVRFGNGTGGSRSITATRSGDRRGFRARDRKGQAGRRASDGGVRRRYRIRARPLHHRRHRPLDRHHGAGAARARRQDAGGRAAIARRRPRHQGRRRRPSPMAAMSRKSRSIPRPASCRSCAISPSTISAPWSIR